MNTDNHVIQQNDLHFRELLTALPNVSVQGYDKRRRVVYWNKASERLYGYSEKEAMGQLLEDLIIPHYMKQGVVDAHAAWINSGQIIPAGELELIDKRGNTVPVYSSHVMLYQHTSQPEMYCVDIDLTNEKQKEQQLQYLRCFDAQTGLYNKESLFEHAAVIAANQLSTKKTRVAIFVGIDELTLINNLFGYSEGDRLILNVVSRLQKCIRPQDFIARYSGDVFVILLKPDENTYHLQQTLSVIKDIARTPYNFSGDLRQVTLSAGICADHDNQFNYKELLKNAEIAMNQAKNSGKNQYLFYESKFDNKLQRSHQLLSGLANAIDKNQFTLLYQPQFNQAGSIVSCEALLRWQHPKLGNISPAEFIPLAESKNKIKMIDKWVMSAVINQIKHWFKKGLTPVPVFMNLSGQSLSDKNFVNTLSTMLTKAAVPYENIGIELTEYALISENESLIAKMKWFQNRGGSLALDDFGTGYSSLSYLTNFPLDYIKIDKYFIASAPQKDQAAAIIRAIFALSDSLNMQVICEGVETEQHLEFIKQHHSGALLQGFLLSKPVPPGALEAFFNKECSPILTG